MEQVSAFTFSYSLSYSSFSSSPNAFHKAAAFFLSEIFKVPSERSVLKKDLKAVRGFRGIPASLNDQNIKFL